LLNFQGYRPDTDALAELSLCKQLERETLREYYRKFLTLKSQLPSVDDQIAIHYAISGLRAGVLYSHCIRDPPRSLQELYQLFEKYARSEELHQRKVESQSPAETAVISSRCTISPTSPPLVRPLAARSIPPRAEEMELTVEGGGVRSSHEDFTACSTAKTARIPQRTAQRRRPPETEWHGHS
jgi:hypothetical protein